MDKTPAFLKWKPPANPPEWIRTTVENPDSDFLHWWQDDRCALCGRRGWKLVCDHDHNTGFIRGWVCQSCNSQEAFAGKGVVPAVDAWRNGVNPAVHLGIEEMYVNSLGVTPMRMRPSTDAQMDEVARRMGEMRREALARYNGQETVTEP